MQGYLARATPFIAQGRGECCKIEGAGATPQSQQGTCLAELIIVQGVFD